jgi:parallel beta-helix repeat protein
MKPWLYGIGLALGITVTSTPGWAADCGDTTGPGGTRVPCACRDRVTMDTKLKDIDPVVSTGPADVCSGDGFFVALSVASEVTLNCNKLTLRGAGRDSLVGVALLDGTSGVTVKNCTVMGFSFGISTVDSGNFSLKFNTVVDNLSVGIDIGFSSRGGTVWGNRVGNNGYGISCHEFSDGNVIAKNHVFGNSLHGIQGVDIDNNSITANTVENNGAAGISLSHSNGNEVMNNHIHDNDGDGIVVLPFDAIGNLIALNVVSDNGGNGINIKNSDNTVESNFGKRNAGSGLEIKSAVGSFVANNEFNKNGGHGICVIPGNTDGGGNIGKLNALPPDVTFSGGC